MTTGTVKVLRIEPGFSVIWDGVLHSIESATAIDRVLLRNVVDGTFCSAPISELKPHSQAADENSPEPHVEDIPKGNMDQACEREIELRHIVLSGTRLTKQNMADLQFKLKLKPSRIYQIVRTLKNDGRPKAIAARKRGPKPGCKKLTGPQEAIVTAAIRARRRSKKPTRINAIHDDIKLACANANIKAPCLETVSSRVHEQAQELALRARLGSKRAREAVTPKPGKIRTTAALALVEIDHSPLDVFLVDSLKRRPIGRAYITVVIDTHTRVVLGFHVSLEAPSVLTVALAVTHAILPKDVWLAERSLSDVSWPMWGIFVQSRTDNADEFHSEAYAAGCKAWGIKPPTFRDIGKKEQGAIVERVIGTIQCAAERLPGATGNCVKHRADYDPAHDAQMTLSEVEVWLARHICEVYHAKKHGGIEMPPRMAWEQAHMTPDGLRPPPIITDSRQLLLDFLPMENRLVTATGIHLFGDRYWAPVLRMLVGRKESLVVRYDPRNMSIIYVRLESGTYADVPYADQTKPALPLWEIKAMRRAKSLLVAAQHDPLAQIEVARKQAAHIKGAKQKTRALREEERKLHATVASQKKGTKSPHMPSSKGLDYTTPVEIAEWIEGEVV